ncbi:hypothetical protein HPE56_14135 [Maribacter sp. ANRC-HE7]|uniref:Uncharacterized protein n=1 Tax=Maribacter aquimaris TaxID=2737171 RepID=A0ABR7V2A3_9FLAO|nr:hypothetical protein [Maribacter aquimaris]MBD0778935.1 hypothetical protein [Maribacter aquimaris]
MMESFTSVEFRKLVNLEPSYAYKVRDYIENVKSEGEQIIHLIKMELEDGSGKGNK